MRARLARSAFRQLLDDCTHPLIDVAFDVTQNDYFRIYVDSTAPPRLAIRSPEGGNMPEGGLDVRGEITAAVAALVAAQAVIRGRLLRRCLLSPSALAYATATPPPHRLLLTPVVGDASWVYVHRLHTAHVVLDRRLETAYVTAKTAADTTYLPPL